MIDFNTISATIRRPGAYVEVSSVNATTGLAQEKRRVLVIGQRLAATATIAALVPTLITQPAQAVQAFGRGSMLAQECAALARTNKSTAEVWAVALDDLGAGVKATQTLTVTGAATGAGTLALRIADTAVPIGVATGDTPTAIAAKIVAAITALPDLPCTAAAVAGVVTLTANHKGVCGNDIDVRANYNVGDAYPAGVSIAVAVGTAGTGNPSLDALWDVLGEVKYHTIVLPYTDAANLTSIETELLDRWGGMRMIEGQAWAATRQAMSDAAALGTSRNSPLVSILPMQGALTPTWQIAAAYAGVAETALSIDPARQLTTLALTGVSPPATADQFTPDERELLLHDGMSTFMVDSGGNVLVERAISTYQKNAYGLPDVAFLDVTTPATIAYLSFTLRDRISTKFPRHKLVDDGTPIAAGQPTVSPSIVKAEEIALAGEWVEAGLIEDLDGFIAGVIVQRSATDVNRVDSVLPPNLVNQFLVFAGQIAFVL